MNKTTKEAWMGKKNELSPEAMEKRKATNKKILKFGCLPILIILILIALIPKNDSDNENDYTVKATKLIEKLRNPKTEKELIADYDKAIALCEEMKNIKDTSNNFLIAQMELEALVTNKDNNIKNEVKKIRVKEQFSSWNGSHKNLEKYINEYVAAVTEKYGVNVSADKQEEFNKFSVDYFTNLLNDKNIEYVETEVNVQMQKSEEGWVITNPNDLVSATLGGAGNLIGL